MIGGSVQDLVAKINKSISTATTSGQTKGLSGQWHFPSDPQAS